MNLPQDPNFEISQSQFLEEQGFTHRGSIWQHKHQQMTAKFAFESSYLEKHPLERKKYFR